MTDEKRQINIENVAVKRRVDLALTDTNLVVFTVCSIFLPYVLSGIILIFLAIYIAVNKHTQKLIFIHSGSTTMKLFFGLVLFVPFVYRNWLGFIVGIGVIFAFILGLFLRSVMTRELYERILTYTCVLSLASTSYAITENVVLSLLQNQYSTRRISAEFFYPNYFGTIASTVIIICAYKIFTKQGQKWMYYFIALMNVFSLYLCKSMFAFAEVFIGIAVLLFILKKYWLLSGWLLSAVFAGFMIFVLKLDIIPRLNDVELTLDLRIQIWRLAEKQILKTPFFGHGFMTFANVYDSIYMIPHSHSLYLDMILNFGVVGTVLFMRYFINYYISVISSCFKEKETLITSLILAVTAAALVHGITDLTLLWIQTLPLFLIVLSGYGALEKQYLT